MSKYYYAGCAAILLAALPVGAGTAFAQKMAGANDEKAIREFTTDNLTVFLKTMDIVPEIKDNDDGSKYLLFTYDGLKMSLYPTACNPNTKKVCVGAFLTASWTPYDDVPRAEMMERINAFDNNYDFVDVAIYEDNAPVMSRYWIADFGITYGNMRTELETFGNLGNKFADEIDKPVAKAGDAAATPSK